MNATRYLKLSAVLFLVAAAVSGYLVWHHYALVNGEAGFGSFCSVSKSIDCDVVNASGYSEVLGVPLATFGLGYYLLALVLCVIGARNPYARREALLLLLPLSILSVVTSVVAWGIMLGLLKTFCLMCSALHAIDILTCILVLVAFRRFSSAGYVAEWRQAQRGKLVAFVVTGGVLFVAAHALTAQLKQDFPFDATQFLAEFRSQPVVSVEPGDSPRQGFPGDNPPVRMVEFADFQCPACGMAARQLHRLLKVYGSRVQLVFKHFPLDPNCNPHVSHRVHEHACLAAAAARCAQNQGKFEEYYEKLFGNQTALTPESLSAWALELGVSKQAFDACLSAPDTKAAIERDTGLAHSLGLTSTPTFFVNGRKVEGVIDENRLRAILKELGQ